MIIPKVGVCWVGGVLQDATMASRWQGDKVKAICYARTPTQTLASCGGALQWVPLHAGGSRPRTSSRL